MVTKIVSLNNGEFQAPKGRFLWDYPKNTMWENMILPDLEYELISKNNDVTEYKLVIKDGKVIEEAVKEN